MAKGNGFQSRTCVHFSTTQRLLAMYQKYNRICRNESEAVHHAAGRSEHGSVDSARRTSQPSFIFTGCKRSRTSTIGKVHTIFVKKRVAQVLAHQELLQAALFVSSSDSRTLPCVSSVALNQCLVRQEMYSSFRSNRKKKMQSVLFASFSIFF
uniref:Uncharacterized protein n=1 Tax=Rhipicephalus microplus TaxID=6941 RepID=A0A6G5AF94_RHIMP